MQNPYMDALYKGGSVVNQTTQTAIASMNTAQNAFNSAGSLSIKMLTLLDQEEAKKNQQLLQTTQLMQNAYDNAMSRDLESRQLDQQMKIHQDNYDLNNKQYNLSLDRYNYTKNEKDRLKLANEQLAETQNYIKSFGDRNKDGFIDINDVPKEYRNQFSIGLEPEVLSKLSLQGNTDLNTIAQNKYKLALENTKSKNKFNLEVIKEKFKLMNDRLNSINTELNKISNIPLSQMTNDTKERAIRLISEKNSIINLFGQQNNVENIPLKMTTSLPKNQDKFQNDNSNTKLIPDSFFVKQNLPSDKFNKIKQDTTKAFNEYQKTKEQSVDNPYQIVNAIEYKKNINKNLSSKHAIKEKLDFNKMINNIDKTINIIRKNGSYDTNLVITQLKNKQTPNYQEIGITPSVYIKQQINKATKAMIDAPNNTAKNRLKQIIEQLKNKLAETNYYPLENHSNIIDKTVNSLKDFIVDKQPEKSKPANIDMAYADLGKMLYAYAPEYVKNIDGSHFSSDTMWDKTGKEITLKATPLLRDFIAKKYGIEPNQVDKRDIDEFIFYNVYDPHASEINLDSTLKSLALMGSRTEGIDVSPAMKEFLNYIKIKK